MPAWRTASTVSTRSGLGRERGALGATALAADGEGCSNRSPLCRTSSRESAGARAPSRGLASRRGSGKRARSTLGGARPNNRCEAVNSAIAGADSTGGAGATEHARRSERRFAQRLRRRAPCSVAGSSSARSTRCSCSRASLERLLNALLARAHAAPQRARAGRDRDRGLEVAAASAQGAGSARTPSRSSARELRRGCARATSSAGSARRRSRWSCSAARARSTAWRSGCASRSRRASSAAGEPGR